MLEKIKASLADMLGVDADSITLDTNFKEDLGASSLDLMELMPTWKMSIPLKYPVEEYENLTTVGKVIDYMKRIGIED